MRRVIARCLLMPLLLAAAPAWADGVQPVAGHDLGEHIQLIRLAHSDDGLRKTYLDHRGRRKDGMLLPRIIAFDGRGRLLGGQSGFKTGDMRWLPRMAHSGRPIPNASGIDDVLKELVLDEGGEVSREALPSGDLYLVVYRAAACDRCDRLDNELHRVIRRMQRHQIILIEVDSDPERLPN